MTTNNNPDPLVQDLREWADQYENLPMGDAFLKAADALEQKDSLVEEQILHMVITASRLIGKAAATSGDERLWDIHRLMVVWFAGEDDGSYG